MVGLVLARRAGILSRTLTMPKTNKTRRSRATAPGLRFKPTSPFPPQHQKKPGIESRMHPRPQFEAPTYRGSGKLAGKVALITGGDSGIGRAVAVLYAREGADIAIAYLRVEQSDADETKAAVECEGARCIQIPGDVRKSGF